MFALLEDYDVQANCRNKILLLLNKGRMKFLSAIRLGKDYMPMITAKNDTDFEQKRVI